jgi:ribosomal protein L11 methyltransferase
MDYMEVRFFNDATYNDAIIAWLAENDYDMFEEREDGVNAYIQSKLFNEKNLEAALHSIPDSKKNISFKTSLIKNENWNKKWESNFEPVFVDDKVYVRAPFHEPSGKYQYEIVIEPKMSFGTGHHATTMGMIKLMLDADFKNKSVLDMGCGTGVLAIFAKKLGASKTTAVDIDEWAFENCKENCVNNNTPDVTILLGDIRSVNDQKFDRILANINRNVLLDDIPKYVECLNSSGEIFLSGFLNEDFDLINKKCTESNLNLIQKHLSNNWLGLQYRLK